MNNKNLPPLPPDTEDGIREICAKVNQMLIDSENTPPLPSAETPAEPTNVKCLICGETRKKHSARFCSRDCREIHLKNLELLLGYSFQP